MSNETVGAAEATLTEVQLKKVLAAQEALHRARVEAVRANAALETANGHLDSLLEVVFDAHGVPLTWQVDLQNGRIVPPDAAAETPA